MTCAIDKDLHNYLRDIAERERIEFLVEREVELALKEPEFALFHPDTISEALGDTMEPNDFDHWCELLAKGENDKAVNFLASFAETARLGRAERVARDWVEKHKNDHDE